MMNARRVLFLDRHTPRSKTTLGGGQRYLLQLVPALRVEGFEVEVCSNVELTTEPFFHQLSQLGARIHSVPFETIRLDLAASRFDEVTSTLKPAILHLHNHSDSMRRIALGMHSFRDPAYKRTLTMHLPLGSVQYAISKRVGLKDRLPLSWYWRLKRTDRRFVRLFDQIICVSQLHAQALTELHPHPRNEIVAIPNGIDVESFSPRTVPHQSMGSVVVIGGAGLLEEYKRFDLLVEATRQLFLQHPIHVRIAGEGTQEQALRAQIGKARLTDSIELTGHQKSMPDYLRSLDVFVMTSDNEGCPYALLEAMATGLPSVVTDAGDMPLIVRDGVDGYVIAKNDPEMLADRIRALVREPLLRERMGHSARKRACDEFSIKKTMQRTTEMFTALTVS